MTRPVSLAMYDPGNGATDRLWSALRPHLADAGLSQLPDQLVPAGQLEKAWLDPNLLLAQTCGYPLRHTLDGRVRYVGTPIYDVDGTMGADNRSAIIVRATDRARSLEDLRGRRAAFNSITSQSGYNAFRAAIAPLARDGRFFGSSRETASHAASLRAVIAGEADAAAIDPISFALAPEDLRAAVKIISWTDAAPGLPFITSLGSSSDQRAQAGKSCYREALDEFLNQSPVKPVGRTSTSPASKFCPSPRTPTTSILDDGTARRRSLAIPTLLA